MYIVDANPADNAIMGITIIDSFINLFSHHQDENIWSPCLKSIKEL